MKKIQYMAEYVALRGFLAVFKCLGPERASNAGGAIFRTIGPRMGISRVAARNIKAAFPDMDDARVAEITRGMWDNLGRVIAEYPHLATIARDHAVITNPEAIPQSVRAGGAALFIGGHLANWELMTQAPLVLEGIAINPVYRAPNNPYVDQFLLKYRAAGGQLRSFGKSRRGLTDVLKTLLKGECVGMLIDQKMNTGIEAAFFGRPAMTATAFAELGRKVGCPVIPLNIVRTHGCNFELTVYEPVVTQGRAPEDVVEETHRMLEGWIAAHPEQWLWLHRRWVD